jgi:hypothetical protein
MRTIERREAMSDNPKCPNCEAAEKRAIAVVVCVSALGLEFLDECKDPQWQDAMAIVKKLKAERNDMARRMIEAVEVIKAIRAENQGQRWSHTLELRMLGVFDSVTHAQLVASNPKADRAGEKS